MRVGLKGRMGDFVASDVRDATPDELKGIGVHRPSGQELFDAMTDAEQDKGFGPVAAARLRAGEITLADLVAESPQAQGDNFLTQRPVGAS